MFDHKSQFLFLLVSFKHKKKNHKGVARREGHSVGVPTPSATAIRPGYEEEPAVGGRSWFAGHYRCAVLYGPATETSVHVFA